MLVPLALAFVQMMPSLIHNGWIDFNKNGRKDVYEDSKQPIELRIKDLLRQMTINEKTCQMATLYGYKRVLKDPLPTPEWKTKLWKDGIANIDEQLNGFSYVYDEVSAKKPRTEYLWDPGAHAQALQLIQRWFVEETRLGIPVDFTDEGISGVENTIATGFPTQLGLGCTWDEGLIRRVGEITGREAYLLGYTNVYAPILDVARDARWGRCQEAYGEDPVLCGRLGAKMVEGLQSQGIASTGKHFAVYGQNKGGREGYSRTDPQVSPFDVENIHMIPWRMACKAGMMGVMSSYNDYSSEPISGTPYWLQGLLRKELGFIGYVVSDSDAVEYLYTKHHVAANPKEAVYQAVMAGLNVRTTFTPPEDFVLPLRELIAENRIPLTVIDSRVADVLRVKFRLGLFDHPYRADAEAARKEVFSVANRRVAEQAAEESLVLLRNEKDLLPLDLKKYPKIAVIGPNADDPRYARAHYGPLGIPVKTVVTELRERTPEGAVKTVRGCGHKDANWPESEILPAELSQGEEKEMQQAVDLAKGSDLVIAVLGDEQWGTSGENKSRTSLQLPGRQQQLLERLYATGKPMVLVCIAGRPMSVVWANAKIPAIVWSFFPGAEGGLAIVRALTGEVNFSGKLTMTFPKTVGQLPLNFPAKPASNHETGSGHFAGALSSKGWAGVQGALYPFGFGLSYTTYRYSDIEWLALKRGEGQLSVLVTNVGKRAGDEIVQAYLHPIVSKVTRYEQSLIDFRRVFLVPGESKRVSFLVKPDSFHYRDGTGKLVFDPGPYELQVGGSCVDTPVKVKMAAVRP